MELYVEEAPRTGSKHPFEGNMDVDDELKRAAKGYSRERILFVRVEATTNLLGG